MLRRCLRSLEQSRCSAGRLYGASGRATAGGSQAGTLSLSPVGRSLGRVAIPMAAAWCLLAGAGVPAAPAPAAIRPAARLARVSVSVEQLPAKVRVHVRGFSRLGRHFLRATGRAGDVRLRLVGASTRPSLTPIGDGTLRSVSARSAGGEVVILVARDALGGYRSAYTRSGRELVLEVDRPARTAQVAAATPAARVTPPLAGVVPARSAAPETAVFPLPAPRADTTPSVRATGVPQRVAVLPGVWHAYGAPDRPQKLVTLDFVNADIQDVVKALAIQSGANILVAPKVEGKVTVGLRSVTPEQALEYIVRLGGLAYGQEEQTYVVCTPDQIKQIFPAGTRGKVLFPPAAEAGETGPTTPAPAPKVKVVRLAKLAAPAAVSLLQKLVPGLEVQTPDPKVMVLIGPEAQLSSAEAAITTLEAATPEPPKGDGTGQSGAAGTTQQPPVITPPKDVEIEVYELKHVNAGEAGNLLKGFMAAQLIPEIVVVPAPAPAYPTTKDTTGARATTQRMGGPEASDAFLNLLYGRAGMPPETGGGAATGQPAPQTAAGGKETTSSVLIPAGSTTNKLLLVGPRESVARVRQYLDRIDVAPRQVMIDLKVTDVSLDDMNNLGLTWSWSDLGIQEIAPTGSTVVNRLQFGRFGHAPVNFTATLKALLTTQKARLLANPRIAVMDGRTANIHVGDTVRYVQSENTGLNGTSFSIGEENVGVQVTVAPRIGGDNVIVLDVQPKVNVITEWRTTPGGGQLPQTSERSVQTVVRLRDGETLAIGGLIRDEDTTAMQKVPGLGDLPLLGELFKHRSRQRRSSEVLIFITPTVVQDEP